MSRGPGIWQRQILDRIAERKVVILTSSGHSPAEQNAIRRAANTLEAAGSIKITSQRIDGRPRLVACPPDMMAPAPHLIDGLDGKTYRMPAIVERHE